MNIPLIDLKAQYNSISEDLDRVTKEVLSSASYIMGKNVTEFEKQFAEEADLRTQTNLVLEAIVNAEALEVTEEEINQEVEELAGQYNMEADQVKSFVSTDMLESDIRLKKAMSLIVDSVEEK